MPNPLLPGLQLQPLPYEDRLPLRDPATLEMVVIHCTELPDLAMARDYGERVLYDSGAGNSGHFYIDRDGSVVQYVAPERVAHHVRGMNAHTLGIELVNTGRYPHWFDSRQQAMDEPYTEAQLQALEQLLLALVARYPSLRRRARPAGPGAGASQRRRGTEGGTQARSGAAVPVGADPGEGAAAGVGVSGRAAPCTCRSRSQSNSRS